MKKNENRFKIVSWSVHCCFTGKIAGYKCLKIDEYLNLCFARKLYFIIVHIYSNFRCCMLSIEKIGTIALVVYFSVQGGQKVLDQSGTRKRKMKRTVESLPHI